MNEKPYTTTQYSLYDKSLYLQRLLFAIEGNFRSDSTDQYATDCKNRLMAEAGNSVDDAILALTDILEIIGYFPAVREIATGEVTKWKQPTKYEGK